MPTRKKTETTDQLRLRISQLADRISVLENNLERTQERVQSDIRMLAERMAETASRG